MPHSRLLAQPDLDRLVQRVVGLVDRVGGRVAIGVAGAPGAGKTTLAEDLVTSLQDVLGPRSPGAAGPWVAHLPMDGYHLADVQLDALGLRERKGAPETFDGHGFLATMARLRSGDPATVYVPGFERVLEQPVAAAIAIPASVRVVVSEGNYLLLEDDPWPRVRALFDEVWYVDLADRERLRRLMARHTQFGKDPDAAQSWALGPDQANAERVLAAKSRADLIIVAPG
ncbi:MAG: nucleoside/nucleotide kinase family protein [Lapillicoccus sp.]